MPSQTRTHALRHAAEALRRRLTRSRSDVRRRAWALKHGAPHAAPVFVVGLQRSGTNMLVQAFEESPEAEIYNEVDPRAFEHFSLRDDAVVRDLVVRSKHRCVVFKCLNDSDRTVHLLDELDTPAEGKAVWIYRDVEGRIRSSLAHFGEDNLQVLGELARGEGKRSWLTRGLSTANREFLAGFDYSAMTPESAAALFWYVRNTLFFELGLDQRADVRLVSYDDILAEPERTIASAASFLGLAYRERMARHIERRPPPIRKALEIDPRVRERCDELERRLQAVAARDNAAAPA